jgi:hypothetical protein
MSTLSALKPPMNEFDSSAETPPSMFTLERPPAVGVER